MFRVYADFNCPFCYVQHKRIKALQLSEKIQWRLIEHAPQLSSQVICVEEKQKLTDEYQLACQRASNTCFNNPGFCVNTHLAILSFISIQLIHPDIASDYLGDIFDAYWLDGQDISDTLVLRNLLAKYKIDRLDFEPSAEALLNHWQDIWCGERLERRIPAIDSDNNGELLGLQHSDNILSFIKQTKVESQSSELICEANTEVFIALVTDKPKQISAALISNDYKIISFSGITELAQYAKKHPPALVAVDYSYDKKVNYETIELMKRSESALKEAAVIYIFIDEAEVHELAIAYNLGAIETLNIADSEVLRQAKIKRRMIDAKKLELLTKNSAVDSLTGVYNRREMEAVLEKLWRIACRKQLPLAFIMIDIDFFKRYNDEYGHIQGDVCLIEIAKILAKNVKRGADVVARFGGEEFLITLFDLTKNEAERIASRIKKSIELAAIKHQNRPKPWVVTASLGLCSIIPHPDVTPMQVIDRADKNLYKAKEAGRNRLVSSSFRIETD